MVDRLSRPLARGGGNSQILRNRARIIQVQRYREGKENGHGKALCSIAVKERAFSNERTYMKYSCKECSRSFANEWGLRVHSSKMHGSAKPKRQKGKVSHTLTIKYCPCCGFNFETLSLLYNK